MKELVKFRIKLPFGNMRIVDSLSITEEAYKAFKWLTNDFSSVDIKINRKSENIVSIEFYFEKVPEAHGGTFNYKERVQMLSGDVFRLQFGEELYLEKIEHDGIIIELKKVYDKERLNLPTYLFSR
jgi:hypothetical protein